MSRTTNRSFSPASSIHVTIPQLTGIDHERLTYRYSGRDFRRTDVHGHVVSDIIA